MGETHSGRPRKITGLAVLWFFLGLWNAWSALQGINADLSNWHLLSEPTVSGWFKTAGPVELCANFALLAIFILILLAALGLFTGKRWSYKLTLAAGTISAFLYFVLGALYLSAPPEIYKNLGAAIVQELGLGVFQIALVIVSWRYLTAR